MLVTILKTCSKPFGHTCLAHHVKGGTGNAVMMCIGLLKAVMAFLKFYVPVVRIMSGTRFSPTVSRVIY